VAKTVETKTGPAVVKASKGRKLVAAGTADEIEILHEVEVEASSIDAVSTDDETPAQAGE